jgi:hypothetical protein
MTIFKQSYLPVAPVTKALVELAEPSLVQRFTRGDKLVLRARAGRVLAIDYEKGILEIGFPATRASLYKATAWNPVADDALEPETDFVSFTESEDGR